MKRKMILSTGIVLVITALVLSFTVCKDTSSNRTPEQTERSKSGVGDSPGDDAGSAEGKSDVIPCNGAVFSTFPTLDSVENEQFAQFLKKQEKMEIKVRTTGIPSDFLTKEIQEYIFNPTKANIEKHEGFFSPFTRTDREEITWMSGPVLPTNGDFILMIIQYTEKNELIQASSGYYLATFTLKGEPLSMAYVFGYEQFDTSKDGLDIIEGRGYCLNTNTPVVRVAIYYKSSVKRREGNDHGTDLEVKEICYRISDEGHISTEKEIIIFPKKNVQWKDRAELNFFTSSDTVRKMLGEIE